MKLLLPLAIIFVGASARVFPSEKIYSQPLNDGEHWMHPRLDPLTSFNLKNTDELSTDYWINLGKDIVQQNQLKTENRKTAKNIILFLGDGMGMPTITATRSFVEDDATQLSFEKFPYTGMSKTYCVNRQVADSACSATAYLSGVKNNYGTIGVSAAVERYNCTSENAEEFRISSIGQWAIDAGKSAGVVTTTRITHASPAGVYAHTANRDWESSVGDDCDTEVTSDIAKQLVRGTTGSKLRVILGGGRRELLPSTFIDEEGKPGLRRDDLNLIEEWKTKTNGTYVWNKQGLKNVDPSTKYLMGLFEPGHCLYQMEIDEQKVQDQEPSLTEMTEKAIDLLSTDDNGFFLFVEGGRIDHAHHDNTAKLALGETAEFARAIEAAAKKVDLEETLIIVTADHSHSFTIAGYPSRTADITGTAGNGQDQIPYYALSYANGPGYSTHVKETGGRVNPNDLEEDRKNNIYHLYPVTVPLDSETHGGEDVPVYAIGPWSHLFTGNYEQHVIPHMMAYAACIGDGLKACDQL